MLSNYVKKNYQMPLQMHSSKGWSVSAERIAVFLVELAFAVDGAAEDVGDDVVVVAGVSSGFRCLSSEFVCRRDQHHLCSDSAK
jgi:hypothetical protein